MTQSTRMKRGGPMRRTPLRRDTGKASLSVPVPAKKRCAKGKGGCGGWFKPARQMQAACSPRCAEGMAALKRAKAERAADIAKREKLKPRSKWLQEAQTAFNAWVRQRDAAKPCISCCRHHNGQWDAGHYLTTGARPELRFDENNVHKQCVPCNRHLHGNLILYRAELIRRVGLAEVERLEGPHEPRKYTAADLREIRDRYRSLARVLSKETTQ